MDEKMLLEAIGKMMDSKLETVKQEMSTMIDEKLEKQLSPLKQDISDIKDRLDAIEESLSETRDGVNTLLGWADSAAHVINVPLKSSQE